jgi:hypothetical protein
MSLLRSLKHRLETASDLSFSDWLVLIKAWFILLEVSLVLRFSNLQKLERSLSLKIDPDSNPANHLSTAWKLQKLVFLASRLLLPPAACLVRACTLQRMLSRRGIPSSLRIGTNQSIQDFHAHAWVEVQGQAVGELEDIQDTFAVLTPPS